jgi:L-ascorbate metabolism protein UlaG (beta-lactamase superfamily)
MQNMKLKWYGTATILLEQDGTQLLFDPFLSLNINVFMPTLDELSLIDNILVTHGHLDHIVDIPAILNGEQKLCLLHSGTSSNFDFQRR